MIDTEIDTVEYEQAKAKFFELRAFVLKFYPFGIAIASIYKIITIDKLFVPSDPLGLCGWILNHQSTRMNIKQS